VGRATVGLRRGDNRRKFATLDQSAEDGRFRGQVCLLGERSLQFFRFRDPGCMGQRDLYPFAILFRELRVN
jgi:hypothetical protein